jgi:hypothetical protein
MCNNVRVNILLPVSIKKHIAKTINNLCNSKTGLKAAVFWSA